MLTLVNNSNIYRQSSMSRLFIIYIIYIKHTKQSNQPIESTNSIIIEILLFLFYRKGNWSLKTLSRLLKMTQMVKAGILKQFCQCSKSIWIQMKTLNMAVHIRNWGRERKKYKVDSIQRIPFCLWIQKRLYAILKTKVKHRKAIIIVGYFCSHCCWLWFSIAFLSLYWLVA